jgi:hypothetical protein
VTGRNLETQTTGQTGFAYEDLTYLVIIFGAKYQQCKAQQQRQLRYPYEHVAWCGTTTRVLSWECGLWKKGWENLNTEGAT